MGISHRPRQTRTHEELQGSRGSCSNLTERGSFGGTLGTLVLWCPHFICIWGTISWLSKVTVVIRCQHGLSVRSWDPHRKPKVKGYR